MSNRWYWLVGLLAVLPRLTAAEPRKEAEPTSAADEQLYSCKTHTGPVAVTFKPDTEVKDLITWVMGFTCKNFILDPRIVATGKKVTLIAPDKLAARDAYQVFLVALSTIGLTVVAKGSVMRVVEASTAKKEALPIYKQVPGDSDQVVRVVIRPSFTQPETLRQAFTQLKSDAGDIAVVGALLVITDYASSLAGMMSLKKLVDVPGSGEGIYTIPVRHGEAAKMAQMLTTMFAAAPAAPAKPGAEPAAGGEPVPSKIAVDERTNTLVISASEPAYQRTRALVDRIDIEVDIGGGGAIHTYQLSSAIAEELAQTLTRAITGDGAQPRPTQRPGQTPGPAAQPPAPANPALDGLGATLQGSVRVIPDKSTNKLIITSSAPDFAALKEVIQQLDQPRRQVYIEAMILEVDVSNGVDFGASAHVVSAAGGSTVLGGVQIPGKPSSLDPTTALAAGGLLGGLLGPLTGSSLLGKSIPSYGVLVQALATNSRTNVLSMPSVIALDNEEAKSKIGENIPFTRGTVPAADGSTQRVANIDRKSLELELNIKPHLSAGDTVLLEIKHTAEDIKDLDGALGPTWTTRSMETRVVVRDQQTVVIGGLMRDRAADGESKVPILGDIPLLGYLFKYKSKSKHKTNLLIMLTPYIIKDQSELQQIQQRKVRENNEFFRSFASLESMAIEPHLDYQRKRGVIEEINRAVQNVEADAAARVPVAPPVGVPAGPIEIPGSPSHEPDAAAVSAPASQ